MKDIGIRQLKTLASGLVKKVEGEHASYTINRHGRPIDILAPAEYRPLTDKSSGEKVWENVMNVMNLMQKRRHTGKTSFLKELSKMRR